MVSLLWGNRVLVIIGLTKFLIRLWGLTLIIMPDYAYYGKQILYLRQTGIARKDKLN